MSPVLQLLFTCFIMWVFKFHFPDRISFFRTLYVHIGTDLLLEAVLVPIKLHYVFIDAIMTIFIP